MALPPTAPALRPKPLSPHLQIWRWTPTMASSILHRITGVGLAGGILFFTAWLVAAAIGAETYAQVQAAARHPLGLVVLAGFTLAFVFHLLNGIRHLVWDFGHGFTPAVASRASIVIFVLTLVISAGVWAAAFAINGGW